MAEQDTGRHTPDPHSFFFFLRQVRGVKKLLQISSNMKLGNNIWSPRQPGIDGKGCVGVGELRKRLAQPRDQPFTLPPTACFHKTQEVELQGD